MSQYTSYYLYQKYEKRGEQDWIPCYPNTYSISGDATNPMSLVVKSENDTQCGYTPTPTEPMYRWINLDPSTDYYCDGVAKYYKQQRQVSYDGGTTWSNVVPSEYQMGTSAETSSSDCGGGTIMYRTTSGTSYCSGSSGYDKYVDVYSQVSYDNGRTWATTATTPTLVETNSTDCGYVPPIEPIYRWVSLNPSIDYYCSGTTKYYKLQKQESYDSGTTWTNVTPNEYQMGASAETSSSDCNNYNEVVASGDYKLLCFSNGSGYIDDYYRVDYVPCDGVNVLNDNVINLTAQGISAVTMYIGNCVEVVDSDVSNTSPYQVFVSNSVKYINKFPFETVQNITIGNGIKWINSSEISKIINSAIINTTVPPVLSSNNASSNATFFVPKGCKTIYENTEGWNNLTINEI